MHCSWIHATQWNKKNMNKVYNQIYIGKNSWWCSCEKVSDTWFEHDVLHPAGGPQAEGAGEERPVGPGEWQDAEADPGLAGQHRPSPHCLSDWPHRCAADTAGGSGTRHQIHNHGTHVTFSADLIYNSSSLIFLTRYILIYISDPAIRPSQMVFCFHYVFLFCQNLKRIDVWKWTSSLAVKGRRAIPS